MTGPAEYAACLGAVLDEQREDIRAKLAGVVANLPPAATGIDIMVHPDQDQEGFVTVMVHAIGPDAFVLNKAIRLDRALLEVKMGADGRLNSDLPMFDPFDLPFEVGDVQVEAITAWFANQWPDIFPAGFSRPATIRGAGGFGPARPTILNT